MSLQLARFEVREGRELQLQGIRLFGHPDAPRGLFAVGRLTSTNEPLIAIVRERPTLWRQLRDASKEQREQAQVERFLRDYHDATGAEFAKSVERPGEHPDFIAHHDNGSVTGLECTQLVYGDRVASFRHLEALQVGLMSEDQRRFRHLRGLSVYVIAKTPSQMPPDGPEGVREIAAALEAFTPRPIHLGATGSRLPQQFPPGFVQWTRDDKYGVTARPLTQRDELTPLIDRCQFDLTVDIQSEVLASEGWHQLEARLRAKDLPGADTVLVSCGAPVHRGLSFPSDELAAEAIALSANERALAPTLHVKVVYLHAWDTQRLYRFTPGLPSVERLSGDEPVGSAV
jgi:hypothetical protein